MLRVRESERGRPFKTRLWAALGFCAFSSSCFAQLTRTQQSLHGMRESSQTFVATLQPILISPTSQRQFWSRDPPGSQASLFAFSNVCFFLFLVVSVYQVIRTTGAQVIKAIHGGQACGCWCKPFCSQSYPPLHEQAALLQGRCAERCWFSH